MATNRPYDLDEAMHRRIMIAIEFRQPDHLLRKAIWESHIPSQMQLKDDIDLVCVHARTAIYHLEVSIVTDLLLDFESYYIASPYPMKNETMCNRATCS